MLNKLLLLFAFSLSLNAANLDGLYNRSTGSGGGGGGGGASSDTEILYNNSGAVDGSTMTFDGTDHTIGSGQLLIQDGNASAPGLAFASAPGTSGLYFSGGIMSIDSAVNVSGGTLQGSSIIGATTSVQTSNSGYLGISSTSNSAGSADARIYRDADGAIRLNSSDLTATSCKLSIPNAITGGDAGGNPTDSEEIAMNWSGNQAFIQTTASGSGTVRPLRLGAGSSYTLYNASSDVDIYRASSQKLGINELDLTAYVDVIPDTDSANDLGTSSLAWQTLYADQRSIPNQAVTLGVAATTFALTSDNVTLTGDGGGNALATITGAEVGQRIVLEFVDSLITIADDDSHTADTLDLDGDFYPADDATLTIHYDGTSFYEIGRTGGIQYKTTVFSAFSDMIARVTNGSSGTGVVELATNDIQVISKDFDQTTEEGAAWYWHAPDNWDGGTVKFRATWTAAAGAGTVKWDFAGRAYADDDALDQALGTEQTTGADTLLATDDLHITDATPALTVAGSPAAGQMVYFQVTRDVATDTLTADAKLLNVCMQYGVIEKGQTLW